MAEFLTTKGISDRLENIIREADQRIVIISPYINIDEQLKGRLQSRAGSGITIRVVYGKRQNQDDYDWLQTLPSVEVFFCDQLHAKCYFNEKQALLASMNLYQYSQQHNYEMGVLVSKTQDASLYGEIIKEAEHISEQSQLLFSARKSQPSRESGATANVSGSRRKSAAIVPDKGYCIRCKSELSTDFAKPYCQTCFRSWNRFKNAEYEENHCHTCGREHKATLSKPLCRTCYQQYRDLFAAEGQPL